MSQISILSVQSSVCRPPSVALSVEHLHSQTRLRLDCSTQFAPRVTMETLRYPITVRMIGVLQKEKIKMYMISVLWSDQTDIVVYRTFRDFKSFHKQMKKAFPPASKLRKSERLIPRFRDKTLKHNTKRKAPVKSLVRLKFLQNYCNELLSCDPRVGQSADLIQFFHPKDQDLLPEISKNSIMIMPSDGEMRTEAGQGNIGNVTKPFVSEMHKCLAPYETKDTKNKPFKVALDEKVDVLIKDKAGWWLVEKEDKRMAWFPAPYLEKLDDDHNEDDIDGTPERGSLYTAVRVYKATKDDEISVAMGAVVEILQKSDNGWWLIRYNGKTGYIPSMYLHPYNYPFIHMTTSHPERKIPSTNLEQQSLQFSRSQGNLLQLPPVTSSTPSLLQTDHRQRSHSVEIHSGTSVGKEISQLAERRNAYAAKSTTAPLYSNDKPLPTITVEMEGVDEQDGMTVNFESDSSDFSDELGSSTSSFSNLSPGVHDEQLRLSRTPPPMASNQLSPTSGQNGRIIPSVSDPSLYKGPSSPKVPPRPQAQEILTRCTTVTRKNLSKGGLSSTQREILSR